MYLPYGVGHLAKMNGAPRAAKNHELSLKENRVFLRNFTIVDKLTHGGYSTVYEAFRKSEYYCWSSAQNEPPARKLIIKCVRIIDHDSQEVDILKRLKHDNIVTLIDVIRVVNKRVPRLESLTIVTEHGGCTLRKLIGRDGLKPNRIRLFIRQLFDAVHYLHMECGVVHRDLKPSNVVYDAATNRLKIIDFGLAIMHNPMMPNNKRVGTLPYMAPETLSPLLGTAYAADMWALGCIALEMAIGHNPFASDTSAIPRQYLAVINWCVVEDENGAIPIETFVTEQVHDLEYRDLIRKLLVYDSRTRLKISEAIEHPFYSKTDCELDEELEPEPEPEQQPRQQKFYKVFSKLLKFFK